MSPIGSRVAALLAVAVAGCMVAPSPSPSVRSPEPSPTASQATVVLAVDGVAEVVTDTDLFGAAPPDEGAPIATADAETPVFIIDGPISAGGAEWWHVAPLQAGPAWTSGWLAAEDDGASLVARRPACPDEVTLASVLELPVLMRITCFGSGTLELSSTFGFCGAGGTPWSWVPAWLVNVGGCSLAVDESGQAGLPYRIPPGSSFVEDGAAPRVVRGHFDDPAARDCTVTSSDPAFPAPGPVEAVLICRTEFVVEG